MRARIAALGRQIARHYGKRPFVVVGLMNGAIFFLVDLLRELPADWIVLCPTVTSYAGTRSTGRIKGLENLSSEIAGRDVLLVDDILDTGLTLNKVEKRLRQLGARRIEICVLLRKRKRRRAPVKARWIGFDVADHYVVGYGFDLYGRYRGLQDIHVLNNPPA